MGFLVLLDYDLYLTSAYAYVRSLYLVRSLILWWDTGFMYDYILVRSLVYGGIPDYDLYLY